MNGRPKMPSKSPAANSTDRGSRSGVRAWIEEHIPALGYSALIVLTATAVGLRNEALHRETAARTETASVATRAELDKKHTEAMEQIGQLREGTKKLEERVASIKGVVYDLASREKDHAELSRQLATDQLSDRVGKDAIDFSLGTFLFTLVDYPIYARNEFACRLADGVKLNAGLDFLTAPFDVHVRFPDPPRPGEPDPGPFVNKPVPSL